MMVSIWKSDFLVTSGDILMTKHNPLYYIFFLFSLLIGVNCQAGEALLDDLQITLEDSHTQAEFILNGSVTPKVRQFTNPERIVIDFPATKFGKSLEVSNPGGSIISKIKGSKPNEESLRFTFQLKQPVQVRSRIISGRVLGEQKLIIALFPGVAPAEENLSVTPGSSELSAKGGESNWKEQLRVLNQRFAAQEQKIRELEATVKQQGRVLAMKSKGSKVPGLSPAKPSFTPKQMSMAKPQPTSKKQEIKKRPPREKGIETVLREEHAIFEHGFTLEPGFSYTRIDRNRVALSGFLVLDAIALGQISIDEVESDVLLFDLTGRYGVTDRLQVDLNIPFLQRSTTYRTTANVGNEEEDIERTVDLDFALSDISFGFSYQLLGESATWPDIVWSTRARAPTGTHPFGIKQFQVTEDVKVTFPEALPTGNGNWAVTSGLSFVKTLDPAVIFASFSYTYNLEEDYSDISSKSDLVVPGSVKLGNSYQFGLGFALALNESITMSISYSHRYSEKSKTKVTGGDWSKILGSDANSSQLNFGLVYAFTSKFSAVASVGAGLTNDAPDSQFSLRFPYTF
jgi:hypothetical protein